ncbi:unnamed protein product, partial [marine sediment metagenome]
TPDAERKHRVNCLIRYADSSVLLEEPIINRASKLKEIGFGAYDAVHLACAEHCDADVFLTTDDKLLRLARENSRQFKIKVYNPLIWLKEVIENEYRNYDS